MRQAALTRLIRILGLLGSDQDGERAFAALAAHKLVTAAGVTWSDLLRPAASGRGDGKIAVRRVHEYGVDPHGAAEARMRQLKSSNERLEKEVRALRRRLTTLADRERRRQAMVGEPDQS
ncbi:MAG: hypothetical protein P4M09_04430 [Devosia sp.]|nr:hypothetical protein [Devosia sp.]